MDPRQVLAQFDSEMRLHPELHGSDRVEETGGVVRVIGDDSWIAYSRLDSTNASTAIREQTDFFRSLRKRVEWKVFGHDSPPNLPDLLRDAGYVADPAETFMAFDLAEPLDVGPSRTEVEICQVQDSAGLSAAVAVSEEAFGAGQGWSRHDLADRLTDRSLAVFVAFVKGQPASAGRLEMPSGRSFASIWGGGTSPKYRRHGIFRALVGARTEAARSRGYRYLTVDALPTSRPILERLGFVPLTTTTGWVFDPSKL